MRTYLHTLCSEILSDMHMEFSLRLFPDAESFEASSDRTEFDLIILDIELTRKNGILLAHELRDQGNPISIIFISAHEGYLKDGYDVQPVHFLIKPVSREALKNALAADIRINHSLPPLLMKNGNRTSVLQLDQIRYLEVANHQLHIHTRDHECSFRYTLSEIERQLPSHMFSRCHNSYIVNLSCVREISRTEVSMNSGEVLPIGRKYYNSFQKAFIRYMAPQH